MKRLFPVACLLFALAATNSSAENHAGAAAALENAYFQSADGARIHYRFRQGSGPALLIIHGRSIGGAGFEQWTDAFPGRAMVLLDRRGYGSSDLGAMTMDTLRSVNAEDIKKAVEIAGSLGGDGKAAIIAFSLGGMILPEGLNPDQVRWVALLNPGVFGMLADMSPQESADSWTLINGYNFSRLWLPAAQDAWTDSTGSYMIQDLIGRIRRESGPAAPDFADKLITGIRNECKTLSYKALIIEETVWALTHRGALRLDPQIPVFLGTSESDELIPQAAYRRLESQLKQTGSALRSARWPGGHLTPLMDPQKVVPLLEDFDRQPGSSYKTAQDQE